MQFNYCSLASTCSQLSPGSTAGNLSRGPSANPNSSSTPERSASLYAPAIVVSWVVLIVMLEQRWQQAWGLLGGGRQG